MTLRLMRGRWRGLRSGRSLDTSSSGVVVDDGAQVHDHNSGRLAEQSHTFIKGHRSSSGRPKAYSPSIRWQWVVAGEKSARGPGGVQWASDAARAICDVGECLRS